MAVQGIRRGFGSEREFNVGYPTLPRTTIADDDHDAPLVALSGWFTLKTTLDFDRHNLEATFLNKEGFSSVFFASFLLLVVFGRFSNFCLRGRNPHSSNHPKLSKIVWLAQSRLSHRNFDPLSLFRAGLILFQVFFVYFCPL